MQTEDGLPDRNAPNAHPSCAARRPIEFPFPPRDFDPLAAPLEELGKFGIPGRPDRRWQPALHQAWLHFFERPLVFVPPLTVAMERRLVPPPRVQPAVVGGTRVRTSKNWSGASIAPSGGKQFVLVFGEWVVPKPSLPPLGDDRGPPGSKSIYTCSTWIGLDGSRRYLNSSLPQAGTTQSLTIEANGDQSVACSAFFQWWAHTQAKVNFETIPGIDVKPGTRVMALLWAVDPFNVVILLRNFAPLNQVTIFARPAPPIRLRNGMDAFPSISGATAEWIVERPSPKILGSTDLELFPDYGSVGFSSCVAGTARQTGLPTSEEVLKGPRFLRMFEVPNNTPSRTRIISMPHGISVTSLGVTYGGF